MRSPILAAGAALLAVPMLTLGVSVRPAAAAKSPKINSVTLSPRQINKNGQAVQITAVVSPNGNNLGPVTATSSLGQTVTLTGSSSGRYTGSVTIPANTSKKNRSVKVTVKVQYGTRSVSKPSASATQLGGGSTTTGGGDTPPPPPPI